MTNTENADCARAVSRRTVNRPARRLCVLALIVGVAAVSMVNAEVAMVHTGVAGAGEEGSEALQEGEELLELLAAAEDAVMAVFFEEGRVISSLPPTAQPAPASDELLATVREAGGGHLIVIEVMVSEIGGDAHRPEGLAYKLVEVDSGERVLRGEIDVRLEDGDKSSGATAAVHRAASKAADEIMQAGLD